MEDTRAATYGTFDTSLAFLLMIARGRNRQGAVIYLKKNVWESIFPVTDHIGEAIRNGKDIVDRN